MQIFYSRIWGIFQSRYEHLRRDSDNTVVATNTSHPRPQENSNNPLHSWCWLEVHGVIETALYIDVAQTLSPVWNHGRGLSIGRADHTLPPGWGWILAKPHRLDRCNNDASNSGVCQWIDEDTLTSRAVVPTRTKFGSLLHFLGGYSRHFV
jgi:hypothetical protein